MSKSSRFPGLALRACLAIALAFAWGCGSSDPLEEARELQAQGKHEAALEILQELVEARPDLAEARYRYGVALNRVGKPDLAVWALRDAAKYETWAVPAGVELAAGALQTGNYQNAIEATNDILEIEPEHAQALFLRAEAYLGDKMQPDLALADLERVLEKDPENLSALASKAAALIMLDEIDEAEEVIVFLESQALELSQEDMQPGASVGRFCVTRALFEADRRDFEAAQANLEACLERHPADRVVVQEAMSFFDSRGESERATEILTNALELAPLAQHYRRALGERLRHGGKLDEAEEVLRAGVTLGPPTQRSTAWLAVADHFIAQHELDPAIEAFSNALEESPAAPLAARLEYADLLARAKRYDEALEITKDFDNEAYRGLIEARIHFDNDRPAQALEVLEQVAVTWPNNPGARYYAARAAEQLGQFERAIEEYRQSLRSGAEITDAGLRLAKLHLALGEFEAATTAVNHHYTAQPRDEAGVAFLVRMTARLGTPERIRSLFQGLQQTRHYPQALAILTNVVADREGHAAAVRRIRAAEAAGLDFHAEHAAPLLRALVVHLSALGEHDAAATRVADALAAHPERADYHEMLGLALERRSAPIEESRAAYERALELDPKHAAALESLGRLAGDEGALDEALAYLDRASEAAPHNPAPARRAARLCEELGTAEQTVARWNALLKEHPWDGRAAIALARLLGSQGDHGDRTVELARRGMRFGTDPEAGDYLVELHELRGEPELAAEIRRVVAALREHASPSEPRAAPEGDSASPQKGA